MDRTDRALWTQARAGDAEAFGKLFDRHFQAVYEFCFWRTADARLAEDLAAAVFLETWRHRARAPLLEDTVRPWLLGVATNLLRNHWRSVRRRQAALRRLPALAPESDFADDLVSRLDAQMRMRAVLAVIGLLPERDREVLALCAWAGLSYQQAAMILGIPVGTVRSRLAKARARLAARLGEQGGEHGDVAQASASTKPLDRVRPDDGQKGGDRHAGA